MVNCFNVDCQTQGRLKLMIELYVSEKFLLNSTTISLEGSAIPLHNFSPRN
jgi:hypothetical protein